MQVIKRMERNKKILEYLATPVKYESGQYMKTSKGDYIYPTLDDAAAIWEISPERISTIKHKDFDQFLALKDQIRKQLELE